MLRLLVGATLLALTFAGGYAVAAHKTLSLTVDGAQMTVATMKSRVIDVVHTCLLSSPSSEICSGRLRRSTMESD